MQTRLENDGNEREKLLSCPFCDNHNISKIFHRNYAKIGCINCGIFLELNDKTFVTIAEARKYYEEKLIKKRNTRF